MIFQPPTVELTKIHYYDETKSEIPTISREIFDNHLNANVIIKKNFFRHRWVLKINEIGTRKEKIQWRVIVCVLVLSCFVVALVFGLYFTSFGKTSKSVEFATIFTFVSNDTIATTVATTTHEEIAVMRYCENCTDVCLKQSETDVPTCVKPQDSKDPTGCGGICSIDTQFCQLLDNSRKIYQCSNIKATLKCPQHSFNCGNMCISARKRCDGIIHCSNKSDEADCDCNLDTNFRCSDSTSCIANSKRCDGVIDCWDKSDEISCKNVCKNGTIPCRNGDCISKENFCDGKVHCRDHSDEPQGC